MTPHECSQLYVMRTNYTKVWTVSIQVSSCKQLAFVPINGLGKELTHLVNAADFIQSCTSEAIYLIFHQTVRQIFC